MKGEQEIKNGTGIHKGNSSKRRETLCLKQRSLFLLWVWISVMQSHKHNRCLPTLQDSVISFSSLLEFVKTVLELR